MWLLVVSIMDPYEEQNLEASLEMIDLSSSLFLMISAIYFWIPRCHYNCTPLMKTSRLAHTNPV